MSQCAGWSHSRSALLAYSTAATTTTPPCLPIRCLVPISPPEMLITVTPSMPTWTPTLRKNVEVTSSLARGSSIAVAPRIWIYEVQPPMNAPQPHPWFRYIPGAYLMALLVHCHLFHWPWGCRAKSQILCKSTPILQVTVYQPWLPPCVWFRLWWELGNCHAKVGLSDN